jgi:hypothetical protein
MTSNALFKSPTFLDHKVLKNGSSLVLRIDAENGPVICKIANTNNNILEREFVKIQRLLKHNPQLAKRMPKLLDHGIVQNGPYEDRPYYILEFISGRSFGFYLQNETKSKEETSNVVKTIVSSLLDTFEESKFDKAYDYIGGSWLRGQIESAERKLHNLEYVKHFTQSDEISVNGVKLRSLGKCLEEIFSSDIFLRLDKELSFMSTLGHWNFHSENILISDKSNKTNFFVVDPDPHIDLGDPLFGLARLLYSFPHDTSEHEKFEITSDAFLPNFDGADEFFVHSSWSGQVIKNYNLLFAGLDGEGYYELEKLDDRLQNPIVAARLDLNLLLCLVRGVSINHDSNLTYLNDSLRTFRSNGLYLFLTSISYANQIVERFRK